ncbi:hypothetical protein [Rhizobium phage RHph_X3_2]|nr:hypothetical protein [Rhizobium phage RHph_X3_2]
MATRLTSNAATFTSASWAPADETVLQVDPSSAPANALIEVEGRVSASASFEKIEVMNLPEDIFLRIAKMTELRLTLRNNTAGNTVTVYDNE